jgi:hypothetical protein
LHILWKCSFGNLHLLGMDERLSCNKSKGAVAGSNSTEK